MDEHYLKNRDPQLIRIGRTAAVLLLILIVSGSLFTIISPFFGWRTEVVISGSMEPAIRTGSIVIVRPTHTEAIQTGDVIMFFSPDRKSLTTHRVVGVESDSGLRFITRGDANKNADMNAVEPGQVVGTVVHTIPYIGLLVQFIKTPLGFILFLLIPAVILIGREILDLLRAME
jgi:signal peptidase